MIRYNLYYWTCWSLRFLMLRLFATLVFSPEMACSELGGINRLNNAVGFTGVKLIHLNRRRISTVFCSIAIKPCIIGKGKTQYSRRQNSDVTEPSHGWQPFPCFQTETAVSQPQLARGLNGRRPCWDVLKVRPASSFFLFFNSSFTYIKVNERVSWERISLVVWVCWSFWQFSIVLPQNRISSHLE